MEFLYPNMLYALVALIIPIVIHLFNFRRHKTVYFSNTSILKTIEQENSKTKKIKYIITLITRLLFIAALVIAFAYPYKSHLNYINNTSNNLIAVYLDNSMSMQSYSSKKSLLDDARSAVIDLIENINPTQKFVLLTNDRDPKNEYPMNKDEFLIRLDEMKMSSAPLSFQEIYNNLSVLKRKNNYKTASLLAYSDFQTNIFTPNEIINDSSIQVILFPLKSEFQHNIYIDTAWLKNPIIQKSIPNELNVRIVNDGNVDVKSLPVNLSLDDKMLAYTTAVINSYSFTDVKMQFVVDEVGCKNAVLQIQDNPIVFDNDYKLVFNTREIINVTEIKPDNISSPLQILFADDPLVNYNCVDIYSIDNHVYAASHMLVVNENTIINETAQQMLLDFASEGGSLVLFTDNETDRSYLFDKLGLKINEVDENVNKIDYIAAQNTFFDEVFVKLPENAQLPETYKHISFDIQPKSNALKIIALQNSDPFLVRAPYEKGNVFVFSVPLDDEWSEFTNHALFVPIMYKVALLGGNITKLSYILGLDKYLVMNKLYVSGDNVLSLRSKNDLYEIFPIVENRNNKTYVRFYEDLPSAGFYDVYVNDQYITTIAWNDDRNESKMKFYSEEEITKILNDNEINLVAKVDYDNINSDDMMEMVVRDFSLWKLFIIISLISLLIEILVLRFWKS